MLRSMWMWTAVVAMAGCGCGYAQAEPSDEAVLSTLIMAAEVREQSIPPLTVCGVYRAFQTPTMLEVWKQTFRAIDKEMPDSVTNAGDRAAVACAIWESADGEEWLREFQGLWRGPNNWVSASPPVEVRNDYVGGLCRRDHMTPLGLVETTYVSGYPNVRLKPRTAARGWHHISSMLGVIAPMGPLSEQLSAPGSERGWRLAPIESEGDVHRVRMGYFDEHREEAIETTVELSEKLGLAPVRYRRVAVLGSGRGTAEEAQWSRFVAIGPDATQIARSCTSFTFEYGLHTDSPLAQTKEFTCVELRATGDDEGLPGAPLCAVLDSTASDPEVMIERHRHFGHDIAREIGDFSIAEPPAPPADLLELDPAKMAAEIEERYGF